MCQSRIGLSTYLVVYLQLGTESTIIQGRGFESLIIVFTHAYRQVLTVSTWILFKWQVEVLKLGLGLSARRLNTKVNTGGRKLNKRYRSSRGLAVMSPYRFIHRAGLKSL